MLLIRHFFCRRSKGREGERKRERSIYRMYMCKHTVYVCNILILQLVAVIATS